MKNNLVKNELHRAHRHTKLAFALGLAISSTSALALEAITDGATISIARAISGDGTKVIGFSDFPLGDPRYPRRAWVMDNGTSEIITIGPGESEANDISFDGTYIVGKGPSPTNAHAFIYNTVTSSLNDIHDVVCTQMFGDCTIGSYPLSETQARAISADGLATTGWGRLAISDNGATVGVNEADRHGFLYLQNPDGSFDQAFDISQGGYDDVRPYAISDEDYVVAGSARTGGNAHAFTWSLVAPGTIVDIHSDITAAGGTLAGATKSYARGISADASKVIGYANNSGLDRAFLWTAGGVTDLGSQVTGDAGNLGSRAYAITPDGTVVVGQAEPSAGGALRAYRWQGGTGQSIEEWLTGTGLTVPAELTTYRAMGISDDGNVIVGQLGDVTIAEENGSTDLGGLAFIARAGSGLIIPDEVNQGLNVLSGGTVEALRAGDLVMRGAHSRPLSRRVAEGKNTFWLAGDWGSDNHKSRDGDIGLAEMGFGRNFGPLQLNAGLGKTWNEQDLPFSSNLEIDGTYLFAEALLPVTGGLWASFAAYGNWGEADIRRGYLNLGVIDHSKGTPDVDSWKVRARLDWEKAFDVAKVEFSPYAGLIYSESDIDSYTERSGGFPAYFESRSDEATDIEIGVMANYSINPDWNLFGRLEATHRFDDRLDSTRGEVIGVFSFDIEGEKISQNWVTAGIGVEGILAGGKAALSINGTSQGEAADAWVAGSWQLAF